MGAGQGGSGAASRPSEGALFPRRRAWLTEQRIRRRAGGARDTQQSHSPARARGAGAGGRRGRGGCHRLAPHSPGQRGPPGRRQLGLASGRRTPCAPLMSSSAASEVCAQPGGLRAAPRGSSGPARGSAGGPRGGSAEERGRESVRPRGAAGSRGAGGAGAPAGPRRPTHRAAAPRAARPPGRGAPETLAHGRPGAAPLAAPPHCLPAPTAAPERSLPAVGRPPSRAAWAGGRGWRRRGPCQGGTSAAAIDAP